MSYKKLGDLLNVNAEQAEKAWLVAELDGDERHSIGARLGLPYPDVGQSGDAEYSRGLKKLKLHASGKTTTSTQKEKPSRIKNKK